MPRSRDERRQFKLRKLQERVRNEEDRVAFSELYKEKVDRDGSAIVLGKGAFGSVRVFTTPLLFGATTATNEVAIKTVDAAGSENMMWWLEVVALMRCEGHDNVLPLLDFMLVSPSVAHLVFPRMTTDLNRVLAPRPGDVSFDPAHPWHTPAVSQVLSWVLQLVRAVQHIHKLGLLHNDLKPANIFLTGDGVVQVGDFGAAMFVYQKYDPNLKTTRWYRAPEALYGNTGYCHGEGDVWSIGAVFADMLTACDFPGGKDPLQLRIQWPYRGPVLRAVLPGTVDSRVGQLTKIVERVDPTVEQLEDVDLTFLWRERMDLRPDVLEHLKRCPAASEKDTLYGVLEDKLEHDEHRAAILQVLFGMLNVSPLERLTLPEVHAALDRLVAPTSSSSGGRRQPPPPVTFDRHIAATVHERFSLRRRAQGQSACRKKNNP